MLAFSASGFCPLRLLDAVLPATRLEACFSSHSRSFPFWLLNWHQADTFGAEEEEAFWLVSVAKLEILRSAVELFLNLK